MGTSAVVRRALGLRAPAVRRHVELFTHGGDIVLDAIEAAERSPHQLVELLKVMLDEGQLHLKGFQAVLHRTLH